MDGPFGQDAAQRWEVAMVVRLALGFLTVLLGTSIGTAQPVADFYRGKTIQLLIGFTAGGNYD